MKRSHRVCFEGIKTGPLTLCLGVQAFIYFKLQLACYAAVCFADILLLIAKYVLVACRLVLFVIVILHSSSLYEIITRYIVVLQGSSA